MRSMSDTATVPRQVARANEDKEDIIEELHTGPRHTELLGFRPKPPSGPILKPASYPKCVILAKHCNCPGVVILVQLPLL